MDGYMIPMGQNGQASPQAMARQKIVQAMLSGGAPQSVPDAMGKLGAGLGEAMMMRGMQPQMSDQAALAGLGAAPAPMGSGQFPAAPVSQRPGLSGLFGRMFGG
jgi:hypothetical protein